MEMPEGWKSLKTTHIWEPDFANDEVEMALDLMKEMAEALELLTKYCDCSEEDRVLGCKEMTAALKKFKSWR